MEMLLLGAQTNLLGRNVFYGLLLLCTEESGHRGEMDGKGKGRGSGKIGGTWEITARNASELGEKWELFLLVGNKSHTQHNQRQQTKTKPKIFSDFLHLESVWEGVK